jgi:hypothetical protein
VAVRGRHGADLGVMKVEDFAAHLGTEIAHRSNSNKVA